MTVTVTDASNLFPFLAAEEAHRDHQAEEALFLTFNVDLGFFEARLLGILRATGARVTILADAGVWAPDVRAVKHAGRAYQIGLVDQPKAFHPKLMVLVGPKRAIAAVGSGNLTLGGWQYNRELLTVFTGDTDGMPNAFADIRNVLNTLGASGVVDSASAEGIARTIDQLDALLAVAPVVERAHRIHASWDGPLVEHLPSDPVQDLFLAAAFHDPSGNAVRALLSRLQPSRVEVAVQPGWTHIDASALDQVLNAYATRTGASVELLADPESAGSSQPRYRHGKVIEWVTTDGERHALTGSPNLTTVALLRAAYDRGNHELGIVGPIAESLFPGGAPVDPSGVPTLTGTASDESAASESTETTVRVLSATNADDLLTVHLNRTPIGLVTIEAAHRNDHPDAWEAVGTIDSAAVGTFPVPLPGGSRVRASTEGGATSPIFVSDPLQVRMRRIPEKQVSRTHRSTAADLFGDDLELLALLQGELTAFAADVANSKTPAGTHDGHGEQQDREHDRVGNPIEPWLWLQEDTVRRHGPGLASWLLALPRLAASDSSPVPWADIVTDEKEAGLDSDESSDAIDESLAADDVAANTSDLIDHVADAEQLKRKRRAWVVKTVESASNLPLASRLLVLRVTLAFWTAGNWEEADPAPFSLVLELVRSLDVEGQAHEVRERAASLAAIAITVMRQHTDITQGTEQTQRFKQTCQIATPLLDAVSDEVVEAYVTGLRTAGGGALTSGHVADTLANVLTDDPLADVQAAMESRGYEVHRPSPRSMHIQMHHGVPAVVAGEAVGAAQDHNGITVWASNERNEWACVTWQKPDLVTVFNHGVTERWRHQRLPDRLSPAAAAQMLRRARFGNEGAVSLPAVVNKPKHHKTFDAELVLAQAGVHDPTRPPCCW